MFIRRFLWSPALAAALLIALAGGARAESYRVSPAATAATKAAVAEGRPPLHGFPAIEDVTLDIPHTLHPGSLVRATVITSRNVGYVEGRIKYWNVAFEHVRPGVFRLDYHVPLLPPTALGKWTFDVVARSIDGVEIRRSYPIVYRY